MLLRVHGGKEITASFYSETERPFLPRTVSSDIGCARTPRPRIQFVVRGVYDAVGFGDQLARLWKYARLVFRQVCGNSTLACRMLTKPRCKLTLQFHVDKIINMNFNLFFDPRLAFDNVGVVDWGPWIPKIFTRIMRSFNLPTAGHLNLTGKIASLPWSAC